MGTLVRLSGERPGGSRTARSLKRRRQQARELQKQLDRAARMQRRLLPDMTFPVEGFRIHCAYRPCETLAGDFYDLARQPDGVVIMVSDVMGHGAEAALLTMLLKAVFHDTMLVVSDIQSLLSEMSRRLRRLIPEGTFVASAIARLTPGSAEVEFANAGLPYPFILRANHGRVDEVRLGGVPLGIPVGGSTPPYQIRRLELEPRDVLLIASDGIGTVQDGGGRYFGDGGLRETMSRLPGLTGKEAIDELLADAVAFSAGRPFEDDVNLVAVSRDSGGE